MRNYTLHVYNKDKKAFEEIESTSTIMEMLHVLNEEINLAKMAWKVTDKENVTVIKGGVPC